MSEGKENTGSPVNQQAAPAAEVGSGVKSFTLFYARSCYIIALRLQTLSAVHGFELKLVRGPLVGYGMADLLLVDDADPFSVWPISAGEAALYETWGGIQKDRIMWALGLLAHGMLVLEKTMPQPSEYRIAALRQWEAAGLTDDWNAASDQPEERALAVLAKFLFDRDNAHVFRFKVRHADGRIANIYVANERASARFDCLVEPGPSIPLRSTAIQSPQSPADSASGSQGQEEKRNE